MKTQYLYLKDEKNKIIDIHEATEENLEIFQGYLQIELENFEIENIYLTFAYITEFKRLLLETDWKAIVNAELIQAGLAAKYPNLHTERQAWRDEINKLEHDLEV